MVDYAVAQGIEAVGHARRLRGSPRGGGTYDADNFRLGAPPPPLIRSRVGRLDADTDDMLLMPPPRPSPPVPPAPGSEFDDLPPLVPEPGVELIETNAGTWSFMQ